MQIILTYEDFQSTDTFTDSLGAKNLNIKKFLKGDSVNSVSMTVLEPFSETNGVMVSCPIAIGVLGSSLTGQFAVEGFWIPSAQVKITNKAEYVGEPIFNFGADKNIYASIQPIDINGTLLDVTTLRSGKVLIEIN